MLSIVLLAGCTRAPRLVHEYNPYAYHAATPDEHAQRLIWDDKYAEAAAVLEKYGHMCEGVKMHTLLGEAYLRTGRYTEAALEYMTAVDSPRFWDDSTWVDPGVRVLVLGDSHGANCMRAAFDAGQIRADKLLRAAEALLRVCDGGGALEMCSAIADEGLAFDPHMLMARAEAEFQLQEFDDARRDFRLALESVDVEHARKRLGQIERITAASGDGE